MIICDYEQGSDQWYKVRLGKLTASDFHTLMGDSSTRKTILAKKAAERVTGVQCDSDKFKSGHTDRGNALEDDAFQIYSVLNPSEDITKVGFCQLSETVGCSPDGLVGEYGGVEIKSPDTHSFLVAVGKSYIKPEYKTQMQFSMYVTNRNWWDFAMYNPHFEQPCHVIRVERDNEYIEKIKEQIKRNDDEIETLIESYYKKVNK